MTPRVRRLYFTSAIIAFIILAPLFVFYASGYRVNFSNFSIYQTGILVISSQPKGADVFLNDKKLRATTPIRFSTVAPGQYKLRIEKADYLPWSSQIRIAGKASTVISDLPLFYASPKETQLWSGPFEAGRLSEDHKSIVLSTPTEEGNNLHVLSLNGTSRQSIQNIEAGEIKDLQWSAQKNYILLKMLRNEKNIWLLVNTNSASTRDITDLLQQDVLETWWSKQSDDFLFYKTSNGFYRLDIFTGESELITTDVVSSFLPNANGGYFIASDTFGFHIFSYDSTRSEPELIQDLDNDAYTLLEQKNQWFGLLHTGRLSLSLIRNTPGSPLLTLPLSVSVNAIAWNPNNDDEILVADGYELNLVNVQSGQVQLLTRTSQNFEDFGWLPNTHMAYTSNNGRIEVYTTKQEYPSQSTLIQSAEGKYFIGASNDGKSLLFSELRSGQMLLTRYDIR